MKTQQRDDLNALRGIAILSVVLFHVNTYFFKNGHFGVDMFFVLSGYFIFTGHCRMPDRPLFEFFSKRIWRIFPGYFFFLASVLCWQYFLYSFLIPLDFVIGPTVTIWFIRPYRNCVLSWLRLKKSTSTVHPDT